MAGHIRAPATLILVKALPQPSKTYGETVCCAGITAQGAWKRLFPVRFRHLSGDTAFRRWNWVEFSYRRPTADPRMESCHVFEDTISVVGSLAGSNRSRLLSRVVVGSAVEAMAQGKSLALIRPRSVRFKIRPKQEGQIEAERAAFARAAQQGSMFDKELAKIEPSPFIFAFRFEDTAGQHTYTCGDWEIHATFWRWRQSMGEQAAIAEMHRVFGEEYPLKGMAFAIGNQAKRPQTWQLLGVIRLDEVQQSDFGF